MVQRVGSRGVARASARGETRETVEKMRAVRRGSRDVRVVVVLERASETVDVDPFRRGDFGFAHGERVAVGVDVPREEIDVLEAVASAERRHLGGTRELKLQLPRIVELDDD